MKSESSDREVGEIGLSVGTCPHSDPAAFFAQFQIIHNEARLICAVHIELRSCSGNRDLDFRPRVFLNIDIGFVNSRTLLPQTRPRKIRKGSILRRVVAPDLLVCSSVGETQIKALKLVDITLNPKGNSNETPALAVSSLPGHPNQVELNGSVFEVRVLNNGQRFAA